MLPPLAASLPVLPCAHFLKWSSAAVVPEQGPSPAWTPPLPLLLGFESFQVVYSRYRLGASGPSQILK